MATMTTILLPVGSNIFERLGQDIFYWILLIPESCGFGKLNIELLLLPAGKDNFEWFWQDGEAGAVVQARKVLFALVG